MTPAPSSRDHAPWRACSWQPQSQRCEPNTSPVRHLECIRTRTSCSPCDIAVHQRHMLGLIHVVLVADDPELAELGREPRLGHPVHQLLGPEPVGHQLRDGDEGEPVLLARTPRARGRRAIDAVGDSGSRRSRRRDRGRPAAPGPRWPRSAPRAAARRRAGRAAGRRVPGGAGRTARCAGLMRHVDGRRAVGGRDAGGDAEAPVRVDADGEGGAAAPRCSARSSAAGRAGRSARAVSARQISPRPCSGHEVDHLGRDELGRADEVALVLAVLVIGHDDDLAVAQVLDRLLDACRIMLPSC